MLRLQPVLNPLANPSARNILAGHSLDATGSVLIGIHNYVLAGSRMRISTSAMPSQSALYLVMKAALKNELCVKILRWY
jgi:hypothetical protein